MGSVSLGRYVYTSASAIPGGQFMPENNQSQSDRLVHLIRTKIAVAAGPSPTNPLLEVTTQDSGVTVEVQFEDDLSAADEDILTEQVARSADYFIVTTDGATDLGEPATVSVDAGAQSATTLTLKMKDGAGQDINGEGDEVSLEPLGTMKIDKTGGEFDGNGKFSFTIGASLDRGRVPVEIKSETLPLRNLIAKWN